MDRNIRECRLGEEVPVIRSRIQRIGCPQWLVAREVGVHETTFSRWMRGDIPPERKDTIFSALENLEGGAWASFKKNHKNY